MNKARSLAIPVALKFAGHPAGSIWQIAPRETRSGTGLIIMIVPESASGDIQ